MRVAPYNPSTLRRIRAGATAADIGWDNDRYRRICRQHGIERITYVLPDIPSRAEIPFDGIVFDTTGFITHAGVQVMLRAPIEVAVFGSLLSEARKGKGDTLTSSAFRSYQGRKYSSAHVSRAVTAINRIIGVLGLSIKVMRGDGYRLEQSISRTNRENTTL